MACERCRIALGKDEVRGKHLDTIHGWVEYGRYRYYCSQCKSYHYPADKELELSEKGRMSARKEDQLARLSVRMVYEEVEKTYEELTGLPASRTGAPKVVQRFGEEQRKSGAEVRYKAVKGKGKEHVGSDGTMVNIRGEGWKEVKVGAYYKTDEEREKEDVRYVATTGSREEIGRQLYELTGRPSMEKTKEMGFIGDGAEWLEDLRKEHFLKSTGIVDFYHVSEYVGNLGRAFYGENGER